MVTEDQNYGETSKNWQISRSQLQYMTMVFGELAKH